MRTRDGASRGLAVRLGEGRVLAVGPERDLRHGAAAEVVELEGGCVIPGFRDGHLHLATGALQVLARLDLRGARSEDEVLHQVRAVAGRTPPGTWIRGFGWDHTAWSVPRFPDRHALDRVAPEHPVFLARVDGHAAWLGSRALRDLGIDMGTPDPAGGRIERDAGGAPTGLLLETAMEQAAARIPPEAPAERERAVRAALAHTAAHGITAAEDVTEPWAIELYRRLRDARALTLRISAWLPLEVEDPEAEDLRRRHPARDRWLSVSTRKAYLDGTLGSRSAALLDPYADDPGSCGILRHDTGELLRRLAPAARAGWAVALHAIGDAAVRQAVRVLAAIAPGRHRIEHLQLVAPGDAERIAAAGITASVQPVHLADDAPWVRARLGEDRIPRAYAFGSLVHAGVPLVFGSDWPIASLDPRRTLAAAVTRRPAAGGAPIVPAECLTIEQAVAAASRESWVRAGMEADLVVVTEDPLHVPADELERVQVLATYVGGRRVYPDVEAAWS